MDNIERMQRKKQQQKARRKEKKKTKAAKEAADMAANVVSDAMQRMRMLHPALTNNRKFTKLSVEGMYGPINDLTDNDWEQFGRDVANNTHLRELHIRNGAPMGALNDHSMTSLFRGLTRSSSITELSLFNNTFGLDGSRSMLPFLQNANNLRELEINDNYIQSVGFNLLWGALRDSPIKTLNCGICGIESIEINSNHIPKCLRTLYLYDNRINADGCRKLAKLLHGGDSTMKTLFLTKNRIDDESVAILVNVLQNNSSLEVLDLGLNESITNEGKTALLKLVNNVSSIKATLKSNHTLQTINVEEMDGTGEIQQHIDGATLINRENEHNPEAAGRAKVIQSQLHSGKRAALCRLQGVDRSLYSDIDPLHLPEVLAVVGQTHGHSEFHVALKSSIATLFSTVDREMCLEQEISFHSAKLQSLQDELASIRRTKGNATVPGSNKRRRL